MLGKKDKEYIDCGLKRCYPGPNYCCDNQDDHSGVNAECVPISFCEIQGNDKAWIVTTACMICLVVVITILIVLKIKMRDDRSKYFH